MSSVSNYSAIYCLLGGFLIGTGLILILVELIHDADEWTLRIIGISAMVVGLILVILYIKSEKKRTVCNNSTPVSVPLKFVKVDVPLQGHTIVKPPLRTVHSASFERNDFNRSRRSVSPRMVTGEGPHTNHSSGKPSTNQIEHYKPRHFAGHGNRPVVAVQMNSAPLAMQEDITPSLRSSFNSLYFLEHSSGSESETSSYNSMIYLP